MDDGARPPPTPPSAQVVPWRRRRSVRIARRTRRQPYFPVVEPRVALPAPAPSAAPHQIPAGDEVVDDSNLWVLVNTSISYAAAEAEAEAAAAAASRRPALAPADENNLLRSSPQLSPAAAAAGEEKKEKPHDAPPLPPLAAVDHNQNPSSFISIGHGESNAATEGTAGEGKKAAGSSNSKGDQDQRGGGGVASPSAAGGSHLPLPQPGADEDYDEELELGEIPPEKPAPGCNAGYSALLGKEEEMALTVGEEEANTVAAAGETSAATGSSAGGAPAAVVGMDDGKRKAVADTEMSDAELKKRKREVFVGGLSWDANEDDVRAALSAAGEITQVRMIRDRTSLRSNVGYCFVAYREAAMASKAIAEFTNVKIRGKPCRVAVPEGNQKPSKNAQRDPIIDDYNCMYEQRQPSPTLAYITSWDPHANTYAIPASSYAFTAGYYMPRYHTGDGLLPLPADLNHGPARPSGRSQMGPFGSSRPAAQPHRSRN